MIKTNIVIKKHKKIKVGYANAANAIVTPAQRKVLGFAALSSYNIPQINKAKTMINTSAIELYETQYKENGA